MSSSLVQVQGTIPFHVARAYGAPSPARVTAPPALQGTSPGAAASAPGAANGPRGLVAGQVVRGVDFAAASPSASQADALPLYTRSADLVEAAVAVQVGRTIDVTG